MNVLSTILAWVVVILYEGWIAFMQLSFYFERVNSWKTNTKWRFYDPNYKSIGYRELTKLHEKGLKDEKIN